MPGYFGQYVQKGNEFLSLICSELGVKEERGVHILKAVLHTFRNHLNIEESLQLMAQLPMLIKALYVENWNPGKKPLHIKHIDEFLDEVREESNKLFGGSIGDDKETSRVVKGVLRVMGMYLSEGEFRDVMAQFPKDVQEFISSGIDRRFSM